MGFNLIDAVLQRITPNGVDRIAAATGETPAKARGAMTTGAFAIVTGLVHRGSTRAGAASIVSTLQGPGIEGGGMALAPTLLGDHADRLTDYVATSSGMTRSGAATVMASVLPLAAGALRSEVVLRRLDADGLSNMLGAQRQSILAHPGFPSGLGPMLRGPELEGAKDVGLYETASVGAATVRRRRSLVPLAWLALGLLLGAAVLAVGRRPAPPRVSLPQAPKIEAPRPGRATITGADIGKPKPIEPKAQTDDLGAHFAATGGLPDRVALPGIHFRFGTTELTEGDAEIDRLAALMKEHPGTRVRIEGHTDSVGSADFNTPLSFQRAMTVRQKLMDRGIDGSRIEAAGRRDKEPVASNTTSEGRAENRRTDLVILAR
jgi:outer membrane protein OmpA-like peptidoglycan-associated protein